MQSRFDETVRAVAEGAWAAIYGEPGDPDLVRAMNDLAFDSAQLLRDGEKMLSPDAVRGLFGGQGMLTLSLAFSALIGATSAPMRRSMRELADQCAFPAQFGEAGRARLTRAERIDRTWWAQTCVDCAADFLAAAEQGPVEAIVHSMKAGAPDPARNVQQVNSTVLGLCFISAWRLNTRYIAP